jgi:hypothetical protein
MKREDDSSRFSFLWGEVGEGEAECTEEAPLWSDDQADCAVDECRLCWADTTRGGDCALRPVLCAADLSHGFDRLGGSVGGDDNVGIEHGDERLEVAGAESGTKRQAAGEWVKPAQGSRGRKSTRMRNKPAVILPVFHFTKILLFHADFQKAFMNGV